MIPQNKTAQIILNMPRVSSMAASFKKKLKKMAIKPHSSTITNLYATTLTILAKEARRFEEHWR